MAKCKALTGSAVKGLKFVLISEYNRYSMTRKLGASLTGGTSRLPSQKTSFNWGLQTHLGLLDECLKHKSKSTL